MGSWSQYMAAMPTRALHETLGFQAPRRSEAVEHRRSPRRWRVRYGVPNICQVLECARFCGALEVPRALSSQYMRKSERGLFMKRPSHRKRAENARTPNAIAWSSDSVAREAFGVRPIHRRFPSGAGWSVVHGRTGCAKTRGAFYELLASRRFSAKRSVLLLN